MALSTHDEIKETIMQDMEQLKDATYPEDLLAEFSDSAVPVYNSDIIREWVELPGEFCDQWKEYGYDTQKNDGGIIELMRVDLIFYYIEQYRSIWEEIKEEEEN